MSYVRVKTYFITLSFLLNERFYKFKYLTVFKVYRFTVFVFYLEMYRVECPITLHVIRPKNLTRILQVGLISIRSWDVSTSTQLFILIISNVILNIFDRKPYKKKMTLNVNVQETSSHLNVHTVHVSLFACLSASLSDYQFVCVYLKVKDFCADTNVNTYFYKSTPSHEFIWLDLDQWSWLPVLFKPALIYGNHFKLDCEHCVYLLLLDVVHSTLSSAFCQFGITYIVKLLRTCNIY